MNSMTGYGRGTSANDQLEIIVELTSVNRRNFEIATSLPKEWQSLEHKLLGYLRQSLRRGRVNINVRVQNVLVGDSLSWDENSVKATLKKLEIFAEKAGASFELDARIIFDVVRSHLIRAGLPNAEEGWHLLEKALSAAVDQLCAMRREEGSVLSADLKMRIGIITTTIDEICAISRDGVQDYRELLMNRLKQANLELDINDERVLKEIALFADRSDITEEIIRLKSHISQFQKSIGGDELIGRKLEFILQEINREVNTIASKANKTEIINRVLDCKIEIERIREQLQNVQ